MLPSAWSPVAARNPETFVAHEKTLGFCPLKFLVTIYPWVRPGHVG